MGIIYMTIHCEDSLEFVSSLGVFDYVITDPPYPTGGESSIKSSKGVKATREMIDGLAQSYIYAVIKAIKKSDRFAIWLMCDWRQVSYFSSLMRGLGMHNQSCIVWDKVQSSLSARYHPRHELVLHASIVASPKVYLGQDLISIKRNRKRQHPFEKPPELVEKMCHAFPKGRVLDPFCGTGGLLVGAKRLGWDVVGVDIDQEFCDIAKNRLANELC